MNRQTDKYAKLNKCTKRRNKPRRSASIGAIFTPSWLLQTDNNNNDGGGGDDDDNVNNIDGQTQFACEFNEVIIKYFF